MKTNLAELVIENLKKDHGGEQPETIIKKLCTDLLGQAEIKLKVSWNPPPYDPYLLAPLRNTLTIEKDDIKKGMTLLEPITENNFNIYYSSKSEKGNHHLRFNIALEIVKTFFKPAKSIFEESMRKTKSDTYKKVEKLAEFGAYELLMPDEPFQKEIKKLGFTPLVCDELVEIFDVSKLMILKRMAYLAPYPCSVVIIEYDNPQFKENSLNTKFGNHFSPSVEDLVKAKASKTDRYRVVMSINSPGFPYKIPLNKSMPPDTIFYHAAMFKKSLSGSHLMKIENRRVRFEVDVMSLPKSYPEEIYPPLLAFFKII